MKIYLKNIFLLEDILWRPILLSRVVTRRMKWHKLQLKGKKYCGTSFVEATSRDLDLLCSQVFQWVTDIREKGAKSRVFHFTRAMPIAVTKRKVTAKKHRKRNNKGKLTGVKVTRSEEENFIIRQTAGSKLCYIAWFIDLMGPHLGFSNSLFGW